jgi:hypothetical protein
MTLVVRFVGVGSGAVVTLERSPLEVDGAESGKRLRLPASLDGDPSERGAALMKLLTSHKPVKAALNDILGRPVTDPPQPLYVRVTAKSADALPWEQLYSPRHGFCALDRRWPVGRIVARHHDITDRGFVPPLRIVALLSAAGRSGLRQLDAMLASLAGPDARRLGVSLHVISGEPAVLERARTCGIAGVAAEVMANDPAAVARQVTAAQPHVLHVLSHGGAIGGLRLLALATMADFAAGEETGLVRLAAPQLAQALDPCNPWLVVLAACDTAESADGPGLAQDLVEAGVPAVIGMRRLVDLSDTDRFCESLYPEILGTIAAAFAAQEGASARVVLDWACALTAPRVALSGPDPVTHDAWSDPILYVQTDPLRVYRDAAARLSPQDFVFLKAKLDVWRGQRATLDEATTDPEALAEIDARIAELERELTLSLA